jgi:hypothetical protein
MPPGTSINSPSCFERWISKQDEIKGKESETSKKKLKMKIYTFKAASNFPSFLK